MANYTAQELEMIIFKARIVRSVALGFAGALLILMAVLLWVWPETAAAQAVIPAGVKMVCTVPDGQYVNVRNQPRRDAATWGRLHTDDEIEPEAVENGYIQFDFGGRRAFASVDHFKYDVGGEYTVQANGRVRTRKSPGGERVGWVQAGEKLKITAWKYDDDGGLWGYSMGKYISGEFLAAVETGAAP